MSKVLLLILLLSIVYQTAGRHHTGREYLTLPNFFLIGAGKCGTTSLHELIVQHPEICRTPLKELHYFSGDSWERGHSWYVQHFRNATDCPEGKYLIDGTPRYIRTSIAPQRIQSSYSPTELTKKKFILLLREPVSREFSWYRHRIRTCLHTMHKTIKTTEPQELQRGKKVITGYHRDDLCADNNCQVLGCDHMPATEELERHPQSHLISFEEYYSHKRLQVTDSQYVSQIKSWLKYIDRSQLFIINAQTLTENTTDTMSRLSQFMGLKHDWGTNVTLPRLNENYVKATVSCKVYDKLAAYYQPYNEELYALVNGGNKPAQEPVFPRFKDTRSICTP